jgi:hypothetical protein
LHQRGGAEIRSESLKKRGAVCAPCPSSYQNGIS